MNPPATYHGFLDTLVGDDLAIDRERRRLDRRIGEISSAIRSRLTPSIVPGLLWALAMKEIDRVNRFLEVPVSNFAGHARYLRGLCAAVPFSSVEPCDDPQIDDLFELCEGLWSAMFYREMIDDLKLVQSPDVERWQQRFAAMTSLLNAMQSDLMYIEQAEERVNRIFAPFSREIIEPAIGIGTDDAVSGFRVVREEIAGRLEASQELMVPVHNLWQEFRRRSFAGSREAELEAFVAEHREKISERIGASFDQLNHILLFRPTDFKPALLERSTAFLEAFSFRPGEVNRDFRTPYDRDEVRSRPFAQIGHGQFVLVDLCHCSFAPLDRLVECVDTQGKLQRLNKKRDDTLEDEAERLFASVIQPDLMLRNYYIPVGATENAVERDLLMLKGDCLFVIESKARRLRPVKGRHDKLARIATDVKESIQQGYDQACDVIRYVKSGSKRLPIFDSNRQDRRQVAEINPATVREAIPIVFLDSYYGMIAADLAPWIRVDSTIGFPWVVNRDSLESIFLKIDTCDKFKAFLLWRRNLHGVAFNEDEAVFAGFFLRHGAVEMPSGGNRVTLHESYADVFEAEYFRRQGIPVEMPPEETGPPVWTSATRKGDWVEIEIDGKLQDRINLKTGEKRKSRGRKRGKRVDGRVGRNDPCPCGSGNKYKRCCLRA